MGGGVDLPPARKKVKSFRRNVTHIQHALKTHFLFEAFFCIITPSLITGSNEILYKKRRWLFFVSYKG